MRKYSNCEISKEVGVHPNTIRFYEQIGFLPQIPRRQNGYRVYNEVHIEQLKLIRIGLKSELLQNGLRKQIINIIKINAKGKYDEALELSKQHFDNLLKEEKNAKDSIAIVENRILHNYNFNEKNYTRKQTADYLELTIHTLRNWELNGLLKVKRRENGYRIYNGEDIKRLKIISSLRCANYSLSAILRLLNSLDKNKEADIKNILNTPNENEDIVSACDKLLISLANAKKECRQMIKQIEKMKRIKINTPV